MGSRDQKVRPTRPAYDEREPRAASDLPAFSRPPIAPNSTLSFLISNSYYTHLPLA